MDENLVYRQNMNGQELIRYIKAVLTPVLLFLLSVYTISKNGAYGVKLLAPMIGIMWICGAVSALIMKSQRTAIIKETFIAIGGYCASILGFRYGILLLSGVSVQMLMASYNTAITTVSGNTMLGYMQTAFQITAIMVPLGFIGMQIKRILTFKKTKEANKAFEQYRAIHNNNRPHL